MAKPRPARTRNRPTPPRPATRPAARIVRPVPLPGVRRADPTVDARMVRIAELFGFLPAEAAHPDLAARAEEKLSHLQSSARQDAADLAKVREELAAVRASLSEAQAQATAHKKLLDEIAVHFPRPNPDRDHSYGRQPNPTVPAPRDELPELVAAVVETEACQKQTIQAQKREIDGLKAGLTKARALLDTPVHRATIEAVDGIDRLIEPESGQPRGWRLPGRD